jgi:hypothetical protein
MPSLHQLAFAIVLAVFMAPLAATTQERATVQGDWTLNRDLTPAPPRRDDYVRRPEGRRPPGGGGFPGGGGLPGGGFGGGESRRGPSDKEMRKWEAVRSRIEELPQRLVISIDGTRVQVVDEFGRATNLVADGKKQDRLTGDGEFKSIAKLVGGRLVVEEDFDGPKVTTTYERLTSEGESRLQVTLQIEGMPEGRGGRGDQTSRAPITRIYDASKQAPQQMFTNLYEGSCGRERCHASELSECASYWL